MLNSDVPLYKNIQIALKRIYYIILAAVLVFLSYGSGQFRLNESFSPLITYSLLFGTNVLPPD